MDIMVGATKDNIMMVEGEMKEVQNWEVFPMTPMPQAVREAERPEKAASKDIEICFLSVCTQYIGSAFFPA